MISISYLFENKITDTLKSTKDGYLKFEDRLGKETVGAVKDIGNSIKTAPIKFGNFVKDLRGVNYKIKR
jgi:hypothetical protein